MRDGETLASDLFNLPSFEWNSELAREFNFDLDALVIAINDYNYSIPTESTIHGTNKLKNKKDSGFPGDDSIVIDGSASLIRDPMHISAIISSFRRKIPEISCDYGKGFRSYLMFGLEFDSLDTPGSVLDGCVFSNCSFRGCFFESALLLGGKFIECTFENCDFSRSTWNKVSLFGCTFIDCNLEGVKLSDCVQHVTSYFGCELDDSYFVSGSMHRVEIDSSSMKKVSILGTIVTASNILNTNLRNSQIINNRFIGCGFDMLHVDYAVQYLNSYVGCKMPSELEAFFSEEIEFTNEDDESSDGGDDDRGPDNTPDDLRTKSFNEIMGMDDDDD